MIKNFLIVAQDNQGNENLPTRRLTTNTGTPEEPFWMNLGVAWIKKNTKGETFLSCKLEDDRTYKNKDGVDVEVKGKVIILEEEYRYLKNCEERCKFLTSPQDDGTVIDMARHSLNSADEQKRNDKVLDEIGF